MGTEPSPQPVFPNSASSHPYSPECLERLSENSRKGSLWTLEGAQNDARSTVSAPFVPPKTRALDGSITIYQTVSPGTPMNKPENRTHFGGCVSVHPRE